MMDITRRDTLFAAAVFGIGSASPNVYAAPMVNQEAIKAFAGSDVLIVDTRILDKRSLALLPTSSRKTVVDISGQDSTLWRQFRAPLSTEKKVAGLTRWSDYVMARGYLEEQGLRLSWEKKLETGGENSPALLAWVLEKR